MTKDEEQRMLADINKVRTEVSELRQFIVGDRLRNISGIMDILETHRREIYGNESTQDIGLKKRSEMDHGRIRTLEHGKLKLIGWSAGVSAGVTGVLAIIKLLAN